MRIAARTGMDFVAASPDGYLLDEAVVESCRSDARTSSGKVDVVSEPRAAVEGAQVLYTDVWTSMGQEDEHDSGCATSPRIASMRRSWRSAPRMPSRSTASRPMSARRSRRTSYGDRSLVWDQAANRLHVYKAVLALTAR